MLREKGVLDAVAAIRLLRGRGVPVELLLAGPTDPDNRGSLDHRAGCVARIAELRASSGSARSPMSARCGAGRRSPCCPRLMAKACRRRCSRRLPAPVPSSPAMSRAAARSCVPARPAFWCRRDDVEALADGDRRARRRSGTPQRDGARRPRIGRARVCRGHRRRARRSPSIDAALHERAALR